ncbi:MAG: secondary thiamine-phosphate synthase enzyme YjbQ [Acidimicrobiia bacterium]|nr:secondary thiamine-phosphate synthase enzyme YjbQ [Acidimicrobiia bacterium]
MDTELLELRTGSNRAVVDLTSQVAAFVAGKGDGILQVFCPHATAGVALIETGAGSDIDLLDIIDRVLPPDFRYRHQHGSPGHGADHVLPAFIAPSITIPVLDGRMQLGTWQSVVLVDPNRDNPHRQVRLCFLAG